MITLLDTIGPAVWRASWQAAAVALFIVVILRCFGERISPRWRYLFWSVVVVRLVIVATPPSPWSAFNLVVWNQEEKVTSNPHGSESIFPLTTRPSGTEAEPPLSVKSLPESPARQPSATSVSAEIVPSAAGEVTRPTDGGFHVDLVVRIVSSLWLAGCLMFGLRLLATALVLRRQLSACRPVMDVAVLKLLEAIRSQIGLKRTPALLVTPEPISPCFTGTWNPRIILPESIITEPSIASLRHVLAHELAHLVRGDLWTNWLLLAVRILHWFNPVAWWTIRQMQVEREAACDEMALAALGDGDRPAYAATLIELAANLAPSAIAPGMIGLFSSTRRLKARVERLVRCPSVTTLPTPFAFGLLLGIALVGLTDAMPAAGANQIAGEASPVAAKTEGPPAKNQNTEWRTHTIRGRCVDHIDGSVLTGVNVRLFEVPGRTLPIVEIAQTSTDRNGRFEFTGLVPPRPYDRFDRLIYVVYALAEDRPIGAGGNTYQPPRNARDIDIRMGRMKSTLTGKVVNALGQPVAGAIVTTWCYEGRPIPGIFSATTRVDGRFAIEKLIDGDVSFDVVHTDYPETTGHASALPADVTVKLPVGCTLTGQVTDTVTGRPSAGALVTSERLDPSDPTESVASTDAAGRFRIVVPEGRYNFLVEARDRVCIAITDRECLAGEKSELPPFKLIAGGFISGQVVNTASGQPVSDSESGEAIMIGLFSPSQPQGRVIRPSGLASVDQTGRFTLRAAPGDNFPYFVNTRGDRMAWDTRKQPPLIVKEGETTTYDMLITPPVPAAAKMHAARQIVASLSKRQSDRTARILLEFRNLNQTVDETELWCALMRELVAVGRPAVPQLCGELDRTNENRMLRRLGFALRAIGDPRAVPALIRAIPKTLLPSSSDYGLIVNNKELTAFMQTHDLDHGRGIYFALGRPEREIFGALHKLTGQDFDDSGLFGVSLSEDPRRQVLQRRVFLSQAQRWETWWEAHCRALTNDAAYQKVNLGAVDEVLPPESALLSTHARLGEGLMGAVLSPAIDSGEHFYDLDTGFKPKWPAHIPRDEAQLAQKQLAKWAAGKGVDLMCVTRQSPDGTQTFVLRAFDMKVWEISQRDLRNIDRLIAAGSLPQGRAVGELLMHYDSESRQYVPDADAAFIFITREGSMGLIETTDRVTRTANLSGFAGGPPRGLGFHKGVRFNVKPIIP